MKPCVLHVGATNDQGYGVVWRDGRTRLHDMTGDNVRWMHQSDRKNPSRVCRACDIENKRQGRRKVRV